MTEFAAEVSSKKSVPWRRPLSKLAVLALCGIALAGCVVYPLGYYPHGGYYHDDCCRDHWRHGGWDRD